MPWLLIILGAIFLLKNLNLLTWLNWSVVWPVVLILAGLCLLKKRRGHDCGGWPGVKEDKKQLTK